MNRKAIAVLNPLNSSKYYLNTSIGQAIFSNTYGATRESGEPVIIKTLTHSLREHPDFDRFKQQLLERAQCFARCQHPNLARVLDSFENNGQLYIVYEYIPGQTLAQLIEQVSWLPEDKALDCIRQIGAALTVLHAADLQHQDVKPQNLIRRQDTDEVVLTDFGLICELTPGIQQTYASLISPGYAASEWYHSESSWTHATDVYALAATLYCLLTGSPPLPAPLRGHVPASDWQQFSPQHSPAVKKAIRWGLKMAAEQRPQTVKDWLSVLPLQKRGEEGERGRGGEKLQLTTQLDHSLQLGRGEDEETGSDSTTTTKHLVFHTPTSATTCAPTSKTSHSSLLTSRTKKPQDTRTSRRSIGKARFPIGVFLITSAIAASTGAGFGLAVRFTPPEQQSFPLLNPEQSFPPRDDWPISAPGLFPTREERGEGEMGR